MGSSIRMLERLETEVLDFYFSQIIECPCTTIYSIIITTLLLKDVSPWEAHHMYISSHPTSLELCD